MDLDLSSSTALVTGASGGIGWALVEAFVAEGCSVIAAAHSNLRSLQQRVADRGWTGVRCLPVDVTDPDALAAAFAILADEGVYVDIIVANAGIWPAADEALHAASEERIRRTIEVNLLGTIWTVRAWMQHLGKLSGHAPAAVLIGSTAGRFGEAGHADYATAKAGLYGLMHSCKNEIVRLNPRARINLVEPGWTVTPMARPALDIPGVITAAVRTMPLRQLASPADIARTVVFLCSRASRHTSGQVVTVAGGMEGRVLWEPGQIDEAGIKEALGEDG